MIKHSINIKNNTWCVSFRARDRYGKLKQKQLSTGIKAVKGNKRLAEEKAREIVSRFEGMPYIEADSILFINYFEDWLNRNEKRLSVTTFDNYVAMFNKHIKPYFGNTKLRDIKPRMLETYYSCKLDEELSANTIVKQAALIRTVLQDAIKNEYIRTNAADLATRPRRQQPQHDHYTEQELIELWENVKGTKLELPVYLAIFFGLRKSEILGLKWSAIDFDKKTITICNKVVREIKGGKTKDYESSVLKSDCSNRVFVFASTANMAHYNYLSAIKARHEILHRLTGVVNDYICINEIGERLKSDYITGAFPKLLKKHNLRSIRFHDLRHSCLSVLANSTDCTMRQVQAYAGHADYNFTANTYAHVTAEQTNKELNILTSKLNFNG